MGKASESFFIFFYFLFLKRPPHLLEKGQKIRVSIIGLQLIHGLMEPHGRGRVRCTTSPPPAHIRMHMMRQIAHAQMRGSYSTGHAPRAAEKGQEKKPPKKTKA